MFLSRLLSRPVPALLFLAFILGVLGDCSRDGAELPARMTQDSIQVARDDVMHIEFERSGGFAGMRVAFSLDSDTLPQDEAEELQRLVESAAFFELPALIADAASVPDELVYVVTVDSGDRQHTVRARQSNVPQDLQPLIDWLSRRARTRGGG